MKEQWLYAVAITACLVIVVVSTAVEGREKRDDLAARVAELEIDADMCLLAAKIQIDEMNKLRYRIESVEHKLGIEIIVPRRKKEARTIEM